MLASRRLRERPTSRALAVTGFISTFAGSGTSCFAGDVDLATSAKLDFPRDVAIDGNGNLLIADFFSDRTRRVDISTGIITTFAGSATSSTSGDGGQAASMTRFSCSW